MNSRSLILVAVAAVATGCSAAHADSGESTTQAESAALESSDTVWFGRLEVEGGHLKSADGALPKAGTTVKLQLFLDELSAAVCVEYCAALTPHVFVRYDGSSSFTELANVPKGYLTSSGSAAWDVTQSPYHYDASLSIPAGSDRIETYIYWDRVSFSCVLESDETCTIDGPIDGAYQSNFGHNFRIDVSH
jgi:hypothetical protein